ncbi:MAG: hypothetical protein MI741_15050, partial [Rhodospirillales bacterium]|nr:hypothetical protein [Rhodospirillales bacterium]
YNDLVEKRLDDTFDKLDAGDITEQQALEEITELQNELHQALRKGEIELAPCPEGVQRLENIGPFLFLVFVPPAQEEDVDGEA